MEKEEELSANSRMEGPQGPPRKPGGRQNTHPHSPLSGYSLVLAKPLGKEPYSSVAQMSEVKKPVSNLEDLEG